MPIIKTVLFDFDGTISDTGRGITNCVKKSLECFGITENDPVRLRTFVGPPLIDSYMRLYGVDRATGEKLVDKYREFYNDGGGLFESDLYDGTVLMLERLKNGGRTLAIASSKPTPLVKRLLEYFEIDQYFDYISAPPMGHINPPKSELIANALKALGASAESFAMVGDRIFDIEGGLAVGALCVGAAYGYGGEEELINCGAHLIAHTTIQIAELIESYEKTR